MAGGDFVKDCNILSTWDVGAAGGNREDLLDILVNISPFKTPFFSGLGKTVAKGILHESMVDSLPAPGDPERGDLDVHCTPESSDAEFDALDVPCRINNLTHIFRKTYDISDSQQAVLTAGIPNMMVHQASRALKILGTLIEFALLHSIRAVQVAPQDNGECLSPQTCRKMDGIFAVLGWTTDDFACLDEMKQGTTLDPAGSPYTELTPELLADLHELMWAKGAEPQDCYVGPYQKRKISNMFLQGQVRNTTVETRKLLSVIDVFETDFGTVRVNLHRYMPSRRVLFTDNQYLKVAILRAVKAEILARLGNSTKGMVEGEVTLEPRCPASLGQIIALTNDESEE